MVAQMSKTIILLADGMFHAEYSEENVSRAKRKARILTAHNRICRLLSCTYTQAERIKQENGFDSTVFKLGEGCNKNHFWLNTCSSLRYKNKEGRCVECIKEKAVKFAEDLKRKKREKYKEDPEFFKNQKKECYRKNREKVLMRNAEYAKNNPEVIKAISQRCSARARSKQSIYYTSQEMLNHFKLFNNECAYCGDSETRLTVDHVYPVSSDAVDCLRNIVPACLSCNSGKGNREMEAWYKNKPFYTKERFIKILSFTDYTPVCLNQG